MYVVRSGFWATNVTIEILYQVLRQAKSQGVEAVEIETSEIQFQEAKLKPNVTSSFLLPLSDEAQMWADLPAKTRNMIRKARKNGIAISTDSLDSDSLYVHYRENMVRLGIALHTKKFLKSSLEEFRSVKNFDRASGWGSYCQYAIALRHWGCHLSCPGNVLFQYRNHAPIQLLTWEAMKQAMYSGAGF